jgi:MFS family permease
MNNQKIKLLNPLIAPILSLAFIVCSSTPFLTFITLKLKAENFTEVVIGLVQSAFYLGFLIGSLKSERVIVRFGYIRSFVCFSAIFGATILVQGMFIHAWLWTIMRIIAGISIASLYIIIESWILTSSSSNSRSRTLSIYMIAFYASQSISQLLLKTMNIDTITPFILFGVFCYLAIIPVSINYSKTPETSSDTVKKSIKEIYKASPFSFWGSLISGIILSGIYALLPLYAEIYNLSVPYMMAITIGGGFILQWPIGYLSDILERRKVLIASAIGTVIPSILILFFANNAALSYLFCFLLGGFSFVLYPISISQACDRFDAKYIPFVVGIMAATYGIGAFGGPFFTSLFMEIHAAMLFVIIAALSILLSIFGIYFKIKQPKAVPKEEKSEFIPISGTASIAADITTKTIEQNKEQIAEAIKKKIETQLKSDLDNDLKNN